MRPSTRKRLYVGLMLTCLTLIVLAWNVVRLWSVPTAVAMSLVAAVLPPVAVFVANTGTGARRPGPGLERRSWDRSAPPDPDR